MSYRREGRRIGVRGLLREETHGRSDDGVIGYYILLFLSLTELLYLFFFIPY